MTRAALYLRRSKDDKEGSIPVQDAACRAYAERAGMMIVAVETDMESAYGDASAARTGYQRVIELARQRTIDAVVIWQFSRFGRDAAEALARMKELHRLGVAVHSTLEDLTNPLLTGILAVLAEDESRRISERTRPAKRLRASQGWFQAPHAPLGTVREGGVLRPGPDFAVVRHAFELAAAGHGVTEIARRLAARGDGPAPRPGSLVRTLRNPAYVGELQGVVGQDGTVGRVKAQWPAMIERELWDAAQETLARRAVSRPRRNRAARFWAFPLMRCGQCGRPCHVAIGTMVHQSPLPPDERPYYHYFACARHRPVIKARADRVQAWILERLRVLRVARQHIPVLLSVIAEVNRELAARPGARRVQLMQEQAALERRRARAEQGYLDGVLSAARARELKGEADHRLAAIAIELASLPPLVQIDAERMVGLLTTDAWHATRETDPATYGAAVAQLVERVEVMGRDPTDWRLVFRPITRHLMEAAHRGHRVPRP